MNSNRFKIKGKVFVNGKLVQNQVTYGATLALLKSMALSQSAGISNMCLLSNFNVPVDKTLKELTIADVVPFISTGCVVGNNQSVNEDLSRDMKISITETSPYELMVVLRIPANKGNNTPSKNGAILILNGDVNQSVSKGSTTYTPTGDETLFSIVAFDPFPKLTTVPLTVVWNLQIEV